MKKWKSEGEIVIFYDNFEFSDSNEKCLKTIKITIFFYIGPMSFH